MTNRRTVDLDGVVMQRREAVFLTGVQEIKRNSLTKPRLLISLSPVQKTLHGRCPSQSRDRTKIAIEPVEDLADHVLQPRDVSPFEQREALLVRRRTEQVEQGPLQRLDRSRE